MSLTRRARDPATGRPPMLRWMVGVGFAWFRAALLLVALGSAVPSMAGQVEDAERTRLQEELLKLAQKNAWSGVERVWVQLEALGLPLQIEDHIMGAQSAMGQGDMFTALTRLQIGLQLEGQASDDPSSPFQHALGMANGIKAQYGMVHIVILNDGVLPVLYRDPMPFSSEEQKAIGFAKAKLLSERAYMGFLPAGPYKIDTRELDVVAGQEMLEVRFEKR